MNGSPAASPGSTAPPNATNRPRPSTPENPDAALRDWLRQYAKAHPRRGFRPAYHDARGEGWIVNHKKVQRLWREEGLRVPQRRRRKRHGTSTAADVPAADAPKPSLGGGLPVRLHPRRTSGQDRSLAHARPTRKTPNAEPSWPMPEYATGTASAATPHPRSSIYPRPPRSTRPSQPNRRIQRQPLNTPWTQTP